MGLEPTTPSLGSWCAAIALLSRFRLRLDPQAVNYSIERHADNPLRDGEIITSNSGTIAIVGGGLSYPDTQTHQAITEK